MSDITRVVLMGQPNVGKSALFSRMTGVGVISSNYSGTTVEFEESVVIHNGKKVHVRDLPGTYSLNANSLDESVAIDMLRSEEYDWVVVIADATDLSGGLVLCTEVLELGLPAILALNKFDAASKRLDIDVKMLSDTLGIPVVPVSAKTSNGVDDLMEIICENSPAVSDFRVGYLDTIRRSVETLSEAVPEGRFSAYGVSLKSLEGCYGFFPDSGLLETVGQIRRMLSEVNAESPEVTINRERYDMADTLIAKAVSDTKRPLTTKEKLSDLTIEPFTGLPILFGVFALIFLTIVYVGAFIDEVTSGAYDWLLGEKLSEWAEGSDSFTASVIEGINGSIGAILGLIVPYILVFYLILGVLEDSGYLTRIVVLMDTVMHRFGLHGGAAIPLMVGIGCNVPAIMATRSIRTRRERLIISTMIILVVPCSAQISIIMGITGKFAGLPYAFGIFAMLVAIGCLIGIVLNRYLPKEPSNLAMNLPDLVVPHPKNVLFKTWARIKDFFFVAFPLLVIGSIVVELLLNYDVLDIVVEPFSFATETMLGLPAVCIICFIVGVLRKEMAVGMLAIVLGENFMDILTPEQFVVFGVVMATYVPCLATITALWKETGIKDTALIIGTSCFAALMLGTCTNLLFGAF